MHRSICWRMLICGLLFSPGLLFAQATLKAKVELNKSGQRVKDASNAVIWLTPIGVGLNTPSQKASEIPRLVQKNKQFHPPLIVIPVGGKVEFPNHDPFF